MNMLNRDLNILCYGGGINSVALLLECTSQGIIFDAILFADPGSEKTASYEYTSVINNWCKHNGQPKITTVKQVNKIGEFVGLYKECIDACTLPSIAFGFKSCSQKFKQFPQNKFCNNWSLAQEAWSKGFKVRKYIGFDADESYRTNRLFDDVKYTCIFPLVEWDWGRPECKYRIINAGLPIPPKSSCTFCPSMKPYEIIDLYENERQAFYEAAIMERLAQPNLSSVKGLGRSFSWWQLIKAYRYLRLIRKYGLPQNVPTQIEKLIKKINASAKLKGRDNIQAVDLFRSSVNIMCECYDG